MTQASATNTLNGAPGASAGTEKMATAFKEALIAGLIALGLAFPLLTHKTVQQAGGLVLEPRWLWALIAGGVVFAGRLALRFLVWDRQITPPSMPGLVKPLAALARPLAGLRAWIGPVLLLLAVVFPFLPGADRRMLDLAILVLTYVMLGWGLNIVVGLAGLLDLGYVAFYAVGAYSFALTAQYFDLGFWTCLPIAGVLAGFWGVILGFPVLRLRGDYLAIVTLAFGEIVRIVLLNWYSFTNGPDGISGIPKPTLFGLQFKRFGENSFADYFGLEYSTLHRFIFLYFIILALALLTNYVTIRLRRLPIGRAWEALREDEVACRSLGINVTNTKLTAFAMGAMFGGFAGSFFATRQGFISPESFTFIESAIILAIVVLGGMGSQIGVAVAAVVMIGGGELVFREFDLYRMLIFGLTMVAIMVWRPRGFVAKRTPSIALGERKAISGELVREGDG